MRARARARVCSSRQSPQSTRADGRARLEMSLPFPHLLLHLDWVLAFEHALTTLRGVDSRPVLVAEERQRTGTSRTSTILNDTFAQVYSLAATAAGAAIAERAASPARA